ncbi:MAG: motility protein A [Clostridiaceae bacterium]|nr:motility protein A [Clostridiaceae bacterium]
MNKFNPMPVLAMVVSIIMIGISIEIGGSILIFVSLSSFIITAIGSFCALVTSFPTKALLNVPKMLRKAFEEPTESRRYLVQLFTGLSRKARSEGLLALEDELSEIDDDFIVKGIQMVVDGIEPESIREILEFEIYAIQKRHGYGHNIFATWGELAPAFGMLGTLIGLILMLSDLSDAANIGTGMATALITTFYGSLMANVILIPIGNKLKSQTSEEIFTKEMVIEGVLSIQSGINPRIIEDKLMTYLPPDERLKELEKKVS